VNAALDLVTLSIALLLLSLAVWVAATTRSRVVRAALILIVAIVIALMWWNLATRGGLHAV
jgi:hypothetical protein